MCKTLEQYETCVKASKKPKKRAQADFWTCLKLSINTHICILVTEGVNSTTRCVSDATKTKHQLPAVFSSAPLQLVRCECSYMLHLFRWNRASMQPRLIHQGTAEAFSNRLLHPLQQRWRHLHAFKLFYVPTCC